jgi:ATP-dependent Clp protease protease subunit
MGSGYSVKAKGKGEADILIYEDVGAGWFGGVTAKQFSEDLKALGNVATINLRIASLGGDVNEGLAIYRRLVDHSARIVTHIDGWAASIASVIAMSGDEIRISEAGAVMIHDAAAIAFGGADEFRAIADRLDATTGAIADVYVARTKNKADQVREWMSAETWFYGREAVDAGFAETVVENLQVAASYNLGNRIFKNPPASLAGADTPNRDALKARLAQMRLRMDRRRAA